MIHNYESKNVFKEPDQPLKLVKPFEKRVPRVTLAEQITVQHSELIQIIQSKKMFQIRSDYIICTGSIMC